MKIKNELNDLISKNVNDLAAKLRYVQDLKLIDTILDIYNGKYNNYGDYYKRYLKEIETYEEMKKYQMKFERSYLISMPPPPAPLLRQEIFDYIFEKRFTE